MENWIAYIIVWTLVAVAFGLLLARCIRDDERSAR